MKVTEVELGKKGGEWGEAERRTALSGSGQLQHAEGGENSANLLKGTEVEGRGGRGDED